MTIDIKEINETVAAAEESMANAATGAIVSVVDAATNPAKTVRQTMRRLEKKGEPINRRLERRAERTADEARERTYDVVSGNLAERLTLSGIRLMKNRARRRDLVGDVLYRGVGVLHRGLVMYVDELSKFKTASELPTRNGERSSSPARRSSRARTTSAARRTRTAAATTARTAGKTARTRTARTRTAVKKSA